MIDFFLNSYKNAPLWHIALEFLVFVFGILSVWFAKKERLFTGREIQEWDSLVGLRETGFRSNGLSLVRKIMTNKHGENWHMAEYKGINLATHALMPSRIYTGAVVEMFGGFDQEPKAVVHGVSHITGGGLPGKLSRVLKPSGLGAIIDRPFEPAELMLYCQEKGNVADAEAYRTWNMGQGMVIITPKPHDVMSIAQTHGIESTLIGRVRRASGISILNKGYFSKGEYLNFP